MDYAAYRGRGIGKTAFLNYVKNLINTDLGLELSKEQEVLYAIYAKNLNAVKKVIPKTDN